MAELETLSGRKRSHTTLDLHLIVERFVSYGGETAAEQLAARKLISRDVRAIQHLESAKVSPSGVQALAVTPGEGLHAWARQNAVAKRAQTPPTGAIASEVRGTAAGTNLRGHDHDAPAGRFPEGSAAVQDHWPLRF